MYQSRDHLITDELTQIVFLFLVNKHHATVEIKHEHNYDPAAAAAAAAVAAEHFLFPGTAGGHHHPQLGGFSFPLPQAPVPAHNYQHLLNGHINNKLMAS